MKNDTVSTPAQFLEWVLLRKSIQENYKDCEKILKELDTFYDEVVKIIGNKHNGFFSQIITIEILGAILHGNKYSRLNFNFNSLNKIFSDTSLTRLKLNYSKKDSKFDLTNPKIYKFLISETSDAEWFFKNFSSDLIVASELFKLVLTTSSVESLQDVLFDFLGPEKIDLICELIQKKNNIIDQVFLLHDKRINYLNSTDYQNKREPVKTISFSNSIAQSNIKRQKRENKKAADNFSKKFSHLNWSFIDNFFEEIKSYKTAKVNAPTLVKPFPNVYNTELSHTQEFVINNKVLKLPPQTRVTKTGTFEEYCIPAHVQTASLVENSRIPINALHLLAKRVFDGFESLNLIQSIIFDKAVNSSENLLICAPTGAGKTNIALLTILRDLILVEEKKLQRGDFRVVYIAPMKALATEITNKFSKALNFLNLKILEVTGDTQFPKFEISTAHIIVTTPEKWDILTRKSNDDNAYTLKTRILIIDEIHLLQEERGAVLEALVARAHRTLESNQISLRIIGLSATLPNYVDVANFLKVNLYTGLFYFDRSFRPVPLEQIFIGIKTMVNNHHTLQEMDRVCFEKVVKFVKEKHQVIVFVHSRDSTRKTAFSLIEHIQKNNLFTFFNAGNTSFSVKKKSQFHTEILNELIEYQISIHHAGLSKHDRTSVEKLFSQGNVKVLFSTSTLAWGVNLPAHAVIIRGTSFYDTNKGSFSNIGILDIQQMFGRAGRPQFDKTGCGILITEHALVNGYIGSLINNYPIESCLLSELSDCINAEIALGSISNIEEAVNYLSYTFLYVRMLQNPLVYGLTQRDLMKDPNLNAFRRELIIKSVKSLEKSKMIRYNPNNGFLNSTALGIIGSHYYIKHLSIDFFNENIKETMSTDEILSVIAKSSEFSQIKAREDEIPELMYINARCPYRCNSIKDMDSNRKVMTLLQACICESFLKSPSLSSDMMYISQNIGRLLRGYYEICVYRGFPVLIGKFLNLIKCFECKLWDTEHPIAQFKNLLNLNHGNINKLKNLCFSMDRLVDFSESDISCVLQNNSLGPLVKKILKSFPVFEINVTAQTLTRTVLQLTLTLKPNFVWNSQIMTSGSEDWVFWIEDYDTHYITYYDQIKISHNSMKKLENITETFTIPIFEPLPAQFIIRLVSLKFLGAEYEYLLSTENLCLPDVYCAFTKLLPLQPLPITALKNTLYQNIYNFKFFNPIQTQTFHSCYNTDHNILLGAPTGSGKTIIAELTILRLFSENPGSKIVYISPMKALIKERINDWSSRMEGILGKKIVELTGDVNPDIKSILDSDIILTTPEKWDGITRGWKDRSYVKNVQLVIIDEVHLLGGDRGHILEAIVSRIRMIINETGRRIRLVALSTSVSNSLDLAKWLDIPVAGVFNFDPSVRLVPLVAHILGFPTKHYCPRMESMNKTVYLSIKNYSPDKPVLIFTSSRRQTRRTAEALLAFSLGGNKSDKWSKCEKSEIDSIVGKVSDSCLKNFLPYGIGIHHAGLMEKDRRVVEELFLSNKIQILIATSTLAWGVNFPAHLVIIKGTEYFDVKTHSYVDFPITDILQMMGRAGRPQFDTSGVGVILVHQTKKNFYKRFLYEPFPVESSLLSGITDHINAEICSGFIKSQSDAVNYLEFSYFIKRLPHNPTFYNLTSTKTENIRNYLNEIIRKSLEDLENSNCIIISENSIKSTFIGILASQYYISYKTVKNFGEKISKNSTIKDLLVVLSYATEFEKVPVRHNEDNYNEDLAKVLPLKLDVNDYSSPFVKVFLLLQAHIGRFELPIKDYYSDTKSILDQALRILQALIDFSIFKQFLKTTIQCVILMQSIVQGCWWHKSSLFCLPGLDISNYTQIIECLSSCLDEKIFTLAQLTNVTNKQLSACQKNLTAWFGFEKASIISKFIITIPRVNISIDISNDGKNFKNLKLANENYSILHLEYIKIRFDSKIRIVLHLNLSTLKGVNCDKRSNSRMGKDVDESWVVLLGDRDSDTLIASKRIPPIPYRTKASLIIGPWDSKEIGNRRILTIYLLGESIYGLDQEYDIPLEIIGENMEY